MKPLPDCPYPHRDRPGPSHVVVQLDAGDPFWIENEDRLADTGIAGHLVAYALEGEADSVEALRGPDNALVEPALHDPLCGLEGVPCPSCAEAEDEHRFDPIEGVYPPGAYR